ncbi:MAG: LytTR family DNA-binding domain-containing protein [Bacteroidota bacterium]
MKQRCLIVDDEELARELIATHLEQLPEFTLVASCASALEARQLLQQEPIDLVFLDIEMPVLKGTEFLKGLRNPPHVIFTTAYRNYAIDGFELNAIDYLLKPITFERFFRATDKFLQQVKRENPQTEPVQPTHRKPHIFVRMDRKRVKINLDEVEYLESLRDYVKIVSARQEYLIKSSLTTMEASLDDRFLRVHRSFIVNIEKVTAYTRQDVELGAKEIPIGEVYKATVSRLLL